MHNPNQLVNFHKKDRVSADWSAYRPAKDDVLLLASV